MAKKLTDTQVAAAVAARLARNQTELAGLDAKILQEKNERDEFIRTKNIRIKEFDDKIEKLRKKKADLPKQIEDDLELLG